MSKLTLRIGDESGKIGLRGWHGNWLTVYDDGLLGGYGLFTANAVGGEWNHVYASGFNDSAQLAFRAFFTDGSAGVFLAGLAPPTPTVLLNQLVDTVIDMHLSHGAETPLLAMLQSALKNLGYKRADLAARMVADIWR